jgi:hypothetical protein
LTDVGACAPVPFAAAINPQSDQVSLGFSLTRRTTQTRRAVTIPAATVGHPAQGTVHAPNIPKHVGESVSTPPPHGN